MWHTCLVNRGYAVWVIYEYENSTDYIANKQTDILKMKIKSK